jgi:hypothetical protein
MTPGELTLSVLHVLSTAATAALMIRVAYLRLHRRYRCFFGYLVFSVIRSFVLVGLDVKSTLYYHIYVFTQPLMWVFYVLMILEIYSSVLEDHKGLYSLSRWTMHAALGISLVIFFLSLMPAGSGPGVQGVVLYNVHLIERGIVFSLAIFMLLAAAFLVRYPVPLSRNVLVHGAVFGVYFLSKTLGFLTRTFLGHRVTLYVGIFLMAAAVGCMVAWLSLLNRAGEAKTVTLRTRFAPAREHQLIGELNAINRTLLRAARR